MNTQSARTRTAKLIGSTVLVGSLFAALTGCGSNDDGVAPETAPETSAAAEPASSEPEAVRVQLVRVVDGDTIEVQPLDDQGQPNGEPNMTVRMLGIDAPESDACGGAAATENLERIVLDGEPLDLKYDEKSDRTDQYDRTLAYVYSVSMGSSDLGGRQVREGYAAAWYPESEPAPKNFEEYEKLAQISMDQKKGVFAECETVGR